MEEPTGVVWRLGVYEQGSLSDLSVGDITAIDYTEGEYVVAKAGAGRVASLPVSSWKFEHCPCIRLSNGSIRYPLAGLSEPVEATTHWVTFSKPAERVKVDFYIPPEEARLDPDVQTLIKERSVTPSGV